MTLPTLPGEGEFSAAFNVLRWKLNPAITDQANGLLNIMCLLVTKYKFL